MRSVIHAYAIPLSSHIMKGTLKTLSLILIVVCTTGCARQSYNPIGDGVGARTMLPVEKLKGAKTRPGPADNALPSALSGNDRKSVGPGQ